MALRCDNCDSLFFKTLETRLLSETVLMYKKRCKRCKYKYLFRRDLAVGLMETASRQDWLAGRKVTMKGQTGSVSPQVFISEYSSRVSRAAEKHGAYLQRIRQAEGIRHEWQKNIGQANG